jgi:hypothetical protein
MTTYRTAPNAPNGLTIGASGETLMWEGSLWGVNALVSIGSLLLAAGVIEPVPDPIKKGDTVTGTGTLLYPERRVVIAIDDDWPWLKGEDGTRLTRKVTDLVRVDP